MKKIAFFDFDGTITTKDTLFEVIKYQKGKAKFFIGLLINAPVLIGLKIKLVSNQRAKEKLLRFFFSGMELSSFQRECDDFAARFLPSIIRPAAVAEINKLKGSGFDVVIVSASAGNWIKTWSDKAEIQLIATQLETIDEKLTGKIKGKNCTGVEKVVRIKDAFDLSQYDQIYCYGDSKGDQQMLALGTKAFYKPFR